VREREREIERAVECGSKLELVKQCSSSSISLAILLSLTLPVSLSLFLPHHKIEPTFIYSGSFCALKHTNTHTHLLKLFKMIENMTHSQAWEGVYFTSNLISYNKYLIFKREHVQYKICVCQKNILLKLFLNPTFFALNSISYFWTNNTTTSRVVAENQSCCNS